ncbi:hypothetical protein DDQ41_20870 [Streptomyces spongiicola]|uniref:Uncharacterized protein n=1 Tax=Streptomyces spongiicola TaxID=1690221 RepID=A0ABN5KNN7_9ACTN|nr:hypothetical protein DDQ41_20870 [Streptomyces spongiicola]
MVANTGSVVPGCASSDDLRPRGPPREPPPCAPRPPARAPSPIRGVIVLTVKLFGETLEAPRTLAVRWQETQ